MARCRLMEKCSLYNDKIRNMVKVPHFLKQSYCQQRSETCMRLQEAGERDVSDIDNFTTPWGRECITKDREGVADKVA